MIDISDLPKLTDEQVNDAILGATYVVATSRDATVVSLQEMLRTHIMTMYAWDLGDDPHGYAGAYDEALQKMAAAFGVELPPSPNI